ncbi:MAG: hypothetical protein O8C66_00985 [Candidatus Methanoperedens sp.]|nr:hypothetical protein [Candidatus Methanoperedens sp.]MCZ7369063.1 hypothetical protein [Candidatus Methanoperedens sp.]
MKEEKLKNDESISEQLENNKDIEEAKAMLKELKMDELNKYEDVLKTVRNIFPNLDKILTPFEIIDALGLVDIAKEGCQACQHCQLCQNCNTCQTCNSCNTCQLQAHGIFEGVPRPADYLARLQLIQILKVLSKHIPIDRES